MSEPYEYEREAAEEAFIDGILNDLGPDWAQSHGLVDYQDAIEEFRTERLTPYYRKNPSLAAPAAESLRYAQSLLSTHPRAALVFATTAIELAVKVVLLKPVVYGLVHTEAIAELVMELSTHQTGMERFQSLLFKIASEYAGVDFKENKRSGSSVKLWDEMTEIQGTRNRLIHRGEVPSDTTAALAVTVATTLLWRIFPQVLQNLGLAVDNTLKVTTFFIESRSAAFWCLSRCSREIVAE